MLRGLGRATRRLRPQAQSLRRRALSVSTEVRTDGFNEALPRRDIVAPLFCAGVYAFSWYAADEGRIQKLAEQVEVNTDPNKNPTPYQVFCHLWPYVAGTLGMLFESVACKFSQTKDMVWLCTTALNDDTNAAVALSLLTPPAEFSAAFTRAICEQPGALPRIKEIVQIYKTLPREQHDDVVVNACVVCAKVAALPELKGEGLSVADFSWMMPEGDKAHLYAQYGLEGVAMLWKEDTRALLATGGVLRTFELLDGAPLRPNKPESSMVNQLLAHRLFTEMLAKRNELVAEGQLVQATLQRSQAVAGTGARKKTVWQRAGVQKGENELEANARARSSELHNLEGSLELLRTYAPSAYLSHIEKYTPVVTGLTAAALGALYGGGRAYFRGWREDVTPSVCRELAAHSSKRTALGALLLVAAFELAPTLKAEALKLAGAQEVASYKDPDALKQLVYIDCAYIAAIGLINFAFPFSLLPWACNPAQVLILPSSQPSPPLRSKSDVEPKFAPPPKFV